MPSLRGGEALLSEGELEPYKVDRVNRFLGALVDSVVVFVVTLVFAVPLVVALPGEVWQEPDAPMAVLQGVFLVAAVLVALVNWYFVVRQGQSIGKMVVGSRIVKTDGAPVDFVSGVILRSWVVAVLGACCNLVGLIDALFIFGEQRKCLHDQIAGTIVVDATTWNTYGGP